MDDGFARALKTGRVVMKPGIDRFDGPQVRFTDRTSCAPGAVICATGYRPGLEPLAGHLVTLDRQGMPPFTGAASSPQHPGLCSSAWTGASTATSTSTAVRRASWPAPSRSGRP